MPRRAAEKLSVEYVRAIKQGNTLGLLVQREGREQVEKRVIEKAQSDPIFAWDLTRRTRETLEKFLDVKIPDVVAVDVIVESPRSFALVIPESASRVAAACEANGSAPDYIDHGVSGVNGHQQPPT